MAYVGKAPQTGAYQILDDIASSFTGSTAGPFNLTVGGTAVLPGNEQSCIISISGVIQDPAAYTISGSQITFSSNPASSDTFFGTVLGNIKVGSCCRIAAGSVVLQEIPPKKTVAGVPAKIVGEAGCSTPSINMDQILSSDSD